VAKGFFFLAIARIDYLIYSIYFNNGYNSSISIRDNEEGDIFIKNMVAQEFFGEDCT